MKHKVSDFIKFSSLCIMAIPVLLIVTGPVVVTMANGPIEAVVTVTPDTFNLESKGKWATAYIELSAVPGFDAARIDVASVRLTVNGYTLPAAPKPYAVGDYDANGVADLMVKFDRALLQARMFDGTQELIISGTADGAAFMGTDSVSVIARGLPCTLLQTSDLHHHASGYGPFSDYTPLSPGDDGVTGGFARLATVIGAIRQQQAAAGVPTLLFDSGDYFMGTTYDLTAADPLALRFFTSMGYDAVTLGNHEFDWSPKGLSLLLNNGLTNGFNVPIVATNTLTDGLLGTDDDGIEALEDAGAILSKKIITLENGLKVGILGLLGENADQDAPVAHPVTFNHDAAFIQAQVDGLRNDDGVDVVVVLSHSGVNAGGWGEDAALADIAGIDIIASGHAHTATDQAFVRGSSGAIVFSPGEYGEWVSRLDFTYSKKLGRVVGYDFNLVPVDDSVPGDPGMQAMVAAYNTGIDAALSAAGLPALGDPITTTEFDLEMGAYQPTGVTGLGSLCADALRNVANALAANGGLDGRPVDVGIVPTGVIRDEIFAGNTGRVTFSDVYNALPLGISPDTAQPVPGYPLMHAYFTGRELYIIAEVGLTLSQAVGSSYYLNFSGVRIEYNPDFAFSLEGVRKIGLYAPDDPLCQEATIDVDPTDPVTLYHGVVNLYAFQLLNVVNSLLPPSHSITPKDKDGNQILDYMGARIDRDPAGGVQELKEWMALLNYLPTLGPEIPETVYGPGGTVEGRIVLVDY